MSGEDTALARYPVQDDVAVDVQQARVIAVASYRLDRRQMPVPSRRRRVTPALREQPAEPGAGHWRADEHGLEHRKRLAVLRPRRRAACDRNASSGTCALLRRRALDEAEARCDLGPGATSMPALRRPARRRQHRSAATSQETCRIRARQRGASSLTGLQSLPIGAALDRDFAGNGALPRAAGSVRSPDGLPTRPPR